MEETRRRDQHISDGGTLAEPPSMRSSTAWPALLARVDARLLVDGGLLLSPETRWRTVLGARGCSSTAWW
jgi:predicted acylesterase/phospholipase RssA